MPTPKTKPRGRKRPGTVNRTPPYKIVMWDNPSWLPDEPVDERTKSALQYVERKTGIKILIAQGSYQAQYGGGAKASAHTHDLGGVVDVIVNHLSRWQRVKLMIGWKKAGGAGWYRRGPGWTGNEHFHWVLRGHRPKHIHQEALDQVDDFDNQRDGLFYNLVDRTWRPKVPRRWSHRQGKPILQHKRKAQP